MKFKFFLALLLGTILTSTNAQHCGNIADDLDIERLLQNRKLVEKGLSVRSGVPVYIPVTFHIVRNSDGSGGIDEDLIANQLCALNADYAPVDMVFYIKDKTFNYVDDTGMYTNPSSTSSGVKMVIEKNGPGSNSINIFICQNAQSNPDALGTTLGYYDPNLDLIVMRLNQVNDFSGTLSHELGHFFSLLHVFNGWDQVAWSEEDHGNPVDSQYSPGGVLNELADGSNCANSGDFLCDTPADYNLGFTWNGCSEYGGGCKDYNGEELMPQENNFMSYFIGCSQYEFSQQQIDMMIADYNSPARNFLKVGYTPNTGDISPAVSVSPADGATVETYNNVKLEWENQPNAAGYLVSVKFILTENKYYVNSNSLTLTDLSPGKTYQWRVLPISEIGGCQSFNALSSFSTGTVASNDPIELNDITVVNSLITDGSIYFSASESKHINVQLFTTSGIIVDQQQLFSQHGINELSISTQLTSGMYFLKMSDENNLQKTFKVIVNN